jgi:hypothetical protein
LPLIPINPDDGPGAKPPQQKPSDLAINSALDAAKLRADNATKALAGGNAANAAQTKALSASLSFALSNSAFTPAPGNFNVDRAATGTGALFHKMQAKSIKPLAVTPNVTDLLTFIRSVEKLATNTARPYQDPLGAFAAYAEDAAITAIAKEATNFGIIGWGNTLRRIFEQCIAAPGPTSMAEAVLRSCPPRKPSQSIDDYYAYFKNTLENAIWVRKLYSQDVSNNWAYSFHVQWVLNLNVAPSIAAVLSALVTPFSTFADVYNTACQGVTPSERAGTAVHLDRLSNVETTSTSHEQQFQDRFNRLEIDNEKIRAGQEGIRSGHHVISQKLNALVDTVNSRPNIFPDISQFRPTPPTRACERSRSHSPRRHRNKSDRIRTPPRQKNPASEIKCYNCGKKGHFSSDCKETCKECGSFSHTFHSCIKRKAGNKGDDRNRNKGSASNRSQAGSKK